VTGAVMAIGMTQTAVTPAENDAEKDKTYAVVQRLLKEVTARHGSVECVDLLGCHIGTPEGMQHAKDNKLFRTRCPLIMRDVVEITERLLGERGFPAAPAAAAK